MLYYYSKRSGSVLNWCNSPSSFTLFFMFLNRWKKHPNRWALGKTASQTFKAPSSKSSEMVRGSTTFCAQLLHDLDVPAAPCRPMCLPPSHYQIVEFLCWRWKVRRRIIQTTKVLVSKWLTTKWQRRNVLNTSLPDPANFTFRILQNSGSSMEFQNSLNF